MEPAMVTRGSHGVAHAVANALYRNPKLLLALLLGPPLIWLGIVYLGSLFALLAQSFFHLDDFSGVVIHEF